MDYKYISSDDHMDLCYIPPTMWRDRLPAKYQETAPKVVQTEKGPVWFREGERWGIYGSKRADGRKVVFDEVGLLEEPEPDVWRPSNAKYRLDDMDRDGVYAQVIYNFLDSARILRGRSASCGSTRTSGRVWRFPTIASCGNT